MLQWTWGCIHHFELVFSFSSDKYPEVEFLGHMVVLFLIFLWNLHTIFHSGYKQFTFPPTEHKGCLFSIFSSTCYFLSFDNTHYNRCEVISHCGLICISLMISDLSIFSFTCCPSVYLFWKSIYLDPLHIFKLGCLAFCYCLVWGLLCILDINALLAIWLANILLMVSFAVQKLYSLL